MSKDVFQQIFVIMILNYWVCSLVLKKIKKALWKTQVLWKTQDSCVEMRLENNWCPSACYILYHMENVFCWVFLTFPSYWKVIWSCSFKMWNMEGVVFALSLGLETNSLTEQQEGNVTSCWLCDGKKLAVSFTLSGFCSRSLTHSGNSSFPSEVRAAWILV